MAVNRARQRPTRQNAKGYDANSPCRCLADQACLIGKRKSLGCGQACSRVQQVVADLNAVHPALACRLLHGTDIAQPVDTPIAQLAKLMVPRNVSERISAKMVYVGPIRAPVREGQTVGQLQVMRGDTKVLEVPVLATETVETGSVAQRASHDLPVA